MTHTYEFPSKSGDKIHATEVREDGAISCSCPGYRHRGECWHTREVKDYAHDPTTCSADGCGLCVRVYNEVRAQEMETTE